MTEGYRERIKHRANFLNGVAVATIGVVGFGVFINLMIGMRREGESPLLALPWFVAGCVFALIFHEYGRRRDTNIFSGHGGRPDRSIRKASLWRAKSANGYDPQVLAALSIMVAEFPQLMKEAMEVLGADEINQARAVLALAELVGTVACVCHQDVNRERVHDYRIPLPDAPKLGWSADVQAFVDRVGDDGNGGRWISDDAEGLPGGTEWADRAMSASWSAKP